MKKTLLLSVFVFMFIGINAQELSIIDVHLHMQDDIMPKGPPIYPVDLSELPDTRIKDVSELLPKTVQAMKTMDSNLCHCGSYKRIVQAIKSAAYVLKEGL
jgi:hypothetical protein